MDEIIQQIIAPDLQKKILLWKILSILVSGFFAFIIVYSKYKTRWTRMSFRRQASELLKTRAYEASQFVKKWEAVKKRLDKGWESEAKLAVIEADELLEDLLERMAYTGENVDERLKELDKSILPNLEEVKKVHQLREDIVHDPDYHLPLDRARWAIRVYEQTFDHFEAL